MIACTIVARNYLAQAKVLAASFQRHHPDDRFYVLVVDGDYADFAADGVATLTPSEVMDPTVFGEMATSYTVIELATAVKPFLLAHLLKSDEVVMYIDPDIEVFTALADVAEQAGESGIVLTPHTLEPVPRDGMYPDEYKVLRAGTFNLGFIAVGQSALEFLEWWQERLRTHCIIAPDAGLFVDQKWVELVPSYWPFAVLRDRGANVAYWNLHERSISAGQGSYLAGGQPLRFFHFSGFDPRQPDRVSTHVPERPRVTMYEPMDELFASYGKQLLENGFVDAVQQPYGLATAPDGTELSQEVRRLFRRGVLEADSRQAPRPPNAFTDPEGFRTWIVDARRHGVDVPPGLDVVSVAREIPREMLETLQVLMEHRMIRKVALMVGRTTTKLVSLFRR